MTSKFYSGFCLNNEESIFSPYLIKNDFTINAFSYGCIKAFDEVLKTSKRVDLLQLFSPAFFQTQDKKFVRLQLMFYKKDYLSYCENFLNNISFPSSYSCDKYFTQGDINQLEELLNYKWCEKDLEKLISKGTKIEVYLGAKDKIIDSNAAMEFFSKYATVYFIKNVGHILKD